MGEAAPIAQHDANAARAARTRIVTAAAEIKMFSKDEMVFNCRADAL